MRIFIAGDSTAAFKAEAARPETGWGECLGKFLAEYSPEPVQIENHAMNGRSTRSFVDQGRLDAIASELRPGDFFFIQFGHNDQKLEDPDRGTAPFGSYQEYLRQYVSVARAAESSPVFLTSITRRVWQGPATNRTLDPHCLGDYPQAMKELGAEINVPVIDVFSLLQEALNAIGEESSTDYFLHLAAGEHPNYPEGVNDDTHLSVRGANLVAQLIAQQIHPLLTQRNK